MRLKRYCILICCYILLCGTSTVFAQVTARIYINGELQNNGDTLIVCKNSSLTFIDSSWNNTGRNWSFNIGTPSSSTSLSPSVTFSSTGIGKVTLIADSASLHDTTYIFVQVQSPTASFSFSPSVNRQHKVD